MSKPTKRLPVLPMCPVLLSRPRHRRQEPKRNKLESPQTFELNPLVLAPQPLPPPSVPLNQPRNISAPGPGGGRRDPEHRGFRMKTHVRRDKSADPDPRIQVKLEKSTTHKTLLDDDSAFLQELKAVAPDFVAQIAEQLKDDERDWFHVELTLAPNPAWVEGSELAATAPDLSSFIMERELLAKLAATSELDSSEQIKLEPLRSNPIPGLARKKFFYALTCSSEQGLEKIIKAVTNRNFLGYNMAFFQARDFGFAYRFQIPLQNLCPPFSKYSVAQWAECWQPRGLIPRRSPTSNSEKSLPLVNLASSRVCWTSTCTPLCAITTDVMGPCQTLAPQMRPLFPQ